ncbi:hypothetical protein EYF80_037806 [Liparis tanakae]|uniref:Uncharacterized protein n=1 Tax=Liparis tanakae TaxID=230148 RepID=A0A4Z2GFD4_9TELE|nr:hypothetical protein EYF80_037806 [Liparis tanakae]
MAFRFVSHGVLRLTSPAPGRADRWAVDRVTTEEEREKPHRGARRHHTAIHGRPQIEALICQLR